MKNNEKTINAIFNKYEKDRLEGKEINWISLDFDLKEELNIGYQSVKPIIIQYYHSYSEICYGYAKNFQCMEFHKLIKRHETQYKL